MAAYCPLADYLDRTINNYSFNARISKRTVVFIPARCNRVECCIKSCSIREVPESNTWPETGEVPLETQQ